MLPLSPPVLIVFISRPEKSDRKAVKKPDARGYVCTKEKLTVRSYWGPSETPDMPVMGQDGASGG